LRIVSIPCYNSTRPILPPIYKTKQDDSGIYVVNPLGRRVSKTLMSSTTNFLYDGANAVQEFGTLPTANLLTGGVDERFTRTTATETDNYLTDALGSTVELTNASGAVEEQYSYGPYGSFSASGATTSNSYAYTGRESDGLGIDYYRARYYSPTTGRFLSEDPLGFAGSGTNLYAYVDDSPTNAIDPSGEFPDFKWYGQYCGPGWTGGHWEQYDPNNDHLVLSTYAIFGTYKGIPVVGLGTGGWVPYYAPPIDALDTDCQTHDQCYYHCRANYKCDKEGRKNCMTQCNQALGQAAANSGVSGPREWLLERYMKNSSAPDSLAGDNDPSCRCKK
jgi:RHS repeat-associated protein